MWRYRAVKLAYGLAIAGVVFCLLAVLVYEKPKSFYTNFIIMPSVYLSMAAWIVDVVAIVLALFALKGPTRKRALLTLGLALGAPVIAMGIIQLMQL